MDRQAGSKGGELCFQQENVLQHMGLVKTIAQRMTEMIPWDMPWEDVLQCGCLGLVEAVRCYDQEKGEFSTLAAFHIYGNIIEGIHAFQGEKRLRKSQRNRYRLQLANSKGEWMQKESLRSEEERQERAREAVEDQISLAEVLRRLTSEERELIEALYYQNKTCIMYAAETQRSVQKIRVMHRRVLKKLRQWLLN